MKLESVGMSGNLLNLIESFFSEKINGQSSEWASIKAVVPYGSVLGPLLFLIYINDLSDGITSNIKFLGDDTSIFSTIHNINSLPSNRNSDLQKIPK